MPPSDQEPRYRLVDSNGNVVGALWGDGNGNVKIADETDTQTTFGPDGISTLALEANQTKYNVSVGTQASTMDESADNGHTSIEGVNYIDGVGTTEEVIFTRGSNEEIGGEFSVSIREGLGSYRIDTIQVAFGVGVQVLSTQSKGSVTARSYSENGSDVLFSLDNAGNANVAITGTTFGTIEP